MLVNAVQRGLLFDLCVFPSSVTKGLYTEVLIRITILKSNFDIYISTKTHLHIYRSSYYFLQLTDSHDICIYFRLMAVTPHSITFSSIRGLIFYL